MVEWKKLGEVTKIVRGNRVTKSDLLENGKYPVISGGFSPLGYIDRYNRDKNTITIAQYGSAGYVDWQKDCFWANDVCYSVYPLDGLNNRYLYYTLINNQYDIYSLRTNAVPAHLPLKALQDIIIPLPPLSEQERIVGILDTFTSSIENLKAQISIRRKQYEHYRDKLLDLEGKPGVEMKTLGEIATTKVGPFGSLLHRKDYIKDGIPLVNPVHMINGQIKEDCSFSVSDEMAKQLSNYRLKPEDIVFARRGEIGRCAIVTQREDGYLCGTGSLIVRFNEKVSSKYMLYLFLSPSCRTYLEKSAIGGSMLNINCTIVAKIPIPLPSLQEQSRIVSILDEFEASIKNLEAQLKAREKQYEYYRNKLLTFE